MPHLSYGSSPPATLTVVDAPRATYLGSQITPRVAAGQQYQVDVNLRNDGGAGFLWAEIFDYDTGEFLAGLSLPYGAGETKAITLKGTMPPRDLYMYVVYGHTDDPYVIPGVVDGQGSPFEIELLILTALTLTLSPATVPKGGTVTWSGRMATDIGYIPNETVYLDQADNFGVSSAVTDANGNFSATFTAPTILGTYAYNARYNGRPFGSYLSAGFSPEATIRVGEPSPVWSWWNNLSFLQKALIVIGTVGTAGAAVYAVKKRKR